MYYKGKGEHSVAELEQIIFELQEKEHFINAPYIDLYLDGLDYLFKKDLNGTEWNILYDIKQYFKAVKNNSTPDVPKVFGIKILES